MNQKNHSISGKYRLNLLGQPSLTTSLEEKVATYTHTESLILALISHNREPLSLKRISLLLDSTENTIYKHINNINSKYKITLIVLNKSFCTINPDIYTDISYISNIKNKITSKTASKSEIDLTISIINDKSFEIRLSSRVANIKDTEKILERIRKDIKQVQDSLENLFGEYSSNNFRPPLTLEEYKQTMITIPEGEFLSGSNNTDPLALTSEMPQYPITLSEYKIGIVPVTVGMYQEFTIQNPEYKSACANHHGEMPIIPTNYGCTWDDIRDHPMTEISWFDAQQYAQWANLDLPTEAQWEKAARGEKGGRYPWGNEFLENGGCYSKGEPGGMVKTQPVGKYQEGKSPYGVLDMIGNVWEWCNDIFQAGRRHGRSVSETRDPLGPSEGSQRVIRGGSWFICTQIELRCAYRFFANPATPWRDRGFRLVSKRS